MHQGTCRSLFLIVLMVLPCLPCYSAGIFGIIDTIGHRIDQALLSNGCPEAQYLLSSSKDERWRYTKELLANHTLSRLSESKKAYLSLTMADVYILDHKNWPDRRLLRYANDYEQGVLSTALSRLRSSYNWHTNPDHAKLHIIQEIKYGIDKGLAKHKQILIENHESLPIEDNIAISLRIYQSIYTERKPIPSTTPDSPYVGYIRTKLARLGIPWPGPIEEIADTSPCVSTQDLPCCRQILKIPRPAYLVENALALNHTLAHESGHTTVISPGNMAVKCLMMYNNLSLENFNRYDEASADWFATMHVGPEATQETAQSYLSVSPYANCDIGTILRWRPHATPIVLAAALHDCAQRMRHEALVAKNKKDGKDAPEKNQIMRQWLRTQGEVSGQLQSNATSYALTEMMTPGTKALWYVTSCMTVAAALGCLGLWTPYLWREFAHCPFAL